MTPSVSILIPSYNHEAYLPACLASIQGQSFEDWEVVLVDDGSNDQSVEVARERAKEDPRIRVYQNPENLGTYGTEQRALELSGGAHIAVMNSDDLWAPDKLAKQLDALINLAEASYCYVAGSMVDASGRPLEEGVHADWPTEPVQNPLPYLLYENRILASGVLFRREGLRFETSCRYSGDWVALLEASMRGSAAYIAEPLTFWRQHEHNTYRRSVNQMREEVRVRRAIQSHAADWQIAGVDPDAISRGLALNALNLMALLVYFGDRRQARIYGHLASHHPSVRRSALKRTLATYLPLDTIRNYLWSEDDRSATDVNPAELKKQLASIPELPLKTAV